jgi:hypothetical protein
MRDGQTCFEKNRGTVNESKIIAAILAIATSPAELRDSSAEMGIENWRKAIKDYERILAELDRDLVKKTSQTWERRVSTPPFYPSTHFSETGGDC